MRRAVTPDGSASARDRAIGLALLGLTRVLAIEVLVRPGIVVSSRFLVLLGYSSSAAPCGSWEIRNTTNSAGLTGATPISMIRLPAGTVEGCGRSTSVVFGADGIRAGSLGAGRGSAFGGAAMVGPPCGAIGG